MYSSLEFSIYFLRYSNFIYVQEEVIYVDKSMGSLSGTCTIRSLKFSCLLCKSTFQWNSMNFNQS
jgi:hypothetical protein